MKDAVEISEIVRNYALVAAAAVGILIAGWRALAADRQARAQARQAEIQRRTHVTELFSKAVEQLRAERLEIRLGALYALFRIAEDFPDFSRQVVELLTGYLRERSSAQEEGGIVPVDIREIVDWLRDATAR